MVWGEKLIVIGFSTFGFFYASAVSFCAWFTVKYLNDPFLYTATLLLVYLILHFPYYLYFRFVGIFIMDEV
jgi:hypothetical protein